MPICKVLIVRIEKLWGELRSELIMLQNFEKKQMDLTNHLSIGFTRNRTKEDYFEEIQKKMQHVSRISVNKNSLPSRNLLSQDIDFDPDMQYFSKSLKKKSNLDKMYSKVNISSSREDVENSIRIKLDSIESIFAEVLTLPTTNFKFEKVIMIRLL